MFSLRRKKSKSSSHEIRRKRLSNDDLRILTIALIIALLFGAYFLRRYFLLLVVSAILTFLFYPLYLRLTKKFKRKSTAAVLTMVTSFLVIIIPLILIGFITYFQVKNIAETLPSDTASTVTEQSDKILDSINHVLANIPGTTPLTPEKISATISSFVSTAATNMAHWLASSFGSFISFITTVIIFIYVFLGMLMGAESIIKNIKLINPLDKQITEEYLNKMGAMTKAMVKGQFIIATLQGFVGALSFYVVGFHNVFVFLWLIFSVLNLIPLGSGIIIIPAGIIMMLMGDVWQGAVILGTHFLITTNIDNILRPRLVPKSARLNPALTILAVFGGVAMFGFLGIVIGPVIMIVISTTIEMYLEANGASKSADS